MSPPSEIAHYRIVSKLGEGGMGAVYRANDTKLGRNVAIKVVPDSFANDPDRLARFTREAQVLASLNHPNIAAIYGVEERAIVMELVEGSEPRGPYSTEAALPLFHQLIDALEYAHEKGVVHRDLKPANLKVTPDGRIKVLDFGLGKALLSAFPIVNQVRYAGNNMIGAFSISRNGVLAYHPMAEKGERTRRNYCSHLRPKSKSTTGPATANP